MGHFKTLCLEINKLMEARAAHVMKKMPLSNVLLKNLCCLSPLVRHPPHTVQMISAVIDSIPHCHLLSGFEDSVIQEWKLYQDEPLAEDLFISAKGHRDDSTPYVSY